MCVDLDEVTLTEEEWNSYLSKFLFSPIGGKYQANFKFKEDLQCGYSTSQILVSIVIY